MIDYQYWRRVIVNDVLPRRLKLTVVAAGVLNYARGRRKLLRIARHNSAIDIDLLKTYLDKRDYDGAARVLYRPLVGDDVDAICEVNFNSIIEPTLNHILYCDLIEGQKDYKSLGLDFPIIPTVAFIRDGQLYGSDRRGRIALGCGSGERVSIEPDREYVVKPAGADSGGGRAVKFLSGRELPNRLTALSRESDLLIVQPIFRGHDFFRSLNPSSLNTIRCVTLMDERGPRLLSAILRIGRQDSPVDNIDSEGIATGVDENGCLKDYAIDRYLRLHRRHPDSGMCFAGLQVPHYQSMIGACLKAHSGLRNLGVLSWDLALSEDNAPIIVELNASHQSIMAHQALNPGSLLPLSPFRSGFWERMKRVWSRYPSLSDLRANRDSLVSS